MEMEDGRTDGRTERESQIPTQPELVNVKSKISLAAVLGLAIPSKLILMCARASVSVLWQWNAIY